MDKELAFFMFYNNKGSIEEKCVFFFAINKYGIQILNKYIT